MNNFKQASDSIMIITLFAAIGKLLGFFRDVLIAAKFGSGVETDTFFIALSAISLFTTIITSSLNTTMIPVLSEIETVEGREEKKRHTNNLLNIVIALSIVIIIIAWLLSPYILRILAYGFEGTQFRLAVLMMRMGLIAIIFASIQGVFRGYLQSELMFTESAAAVFPFNFTYILYLLFLSSFFSIKGLMVTAVLAVLAQILIQVPGLKKSGFKYNFVFVLKDKYIKKMLILIPPILIGVAASDVNIIVDRSMASILIEGSISALNYANRVNGLIMGIFITAITTVIFPMLSQVANKESLDRLKKVIIYGINIILIITIPATVGIIILARPIVKVAFERGAFGSSATYMTVGALIFYSVGLVGMALKSMLIKVYYSLQDTKTPMLNSFLEVGVNIALNLILIRFMAHRGLALATSISSIITMMFLLCALRKKIGSFGFLGSVKCGVKSLFASIVMGMVVYFLNMGLAARMGGNTISELIALLSSVGTGVLVYSVIIYFFRIEEIDWIIKVVKEKLGRK